MSQETFKAMEAAIRAHVADQTDGGYLSAWTLAAAAASVATPDETHYVYSSHDGPPHEWLGLQSMARRRAIRWQSDNDL